MKSTRIAIYPGSFNPWHSGHDDVLRKALKVFDFVIVAQYLKGQRMIGDTVWDFYADTSHPVPIRMVVFNGLLVDYINQDYLSLNLPPIVAVVRGLRNGDDLQYEMNMQYWNEDLGLNIPVVYFVTDRKLSHISSSAIREIEKLGCVLNVRNKR